MECTQRLECTQELYATQTQRNSPEQIGFLGICGTKYPVKKGPNKIGRDPQSCSIVLNLNSISRQHAVINVLNGKEVMLMDLDSANKTKLVGKTLKPYIPHPITNGDTVQFGDIFGIFRLLEDDNDLPMTQAIDIPDTPVFTRQPRHVLTVPESPDVSDRDDSFIVPSQPKGRGSSTKYIKPSAKTISIQPIGANKIDNVFWNSSKKSTSLNLDDSMNDSVVSVNSKDTVQNNEDIHDMETQAPFPNVLNDSTDSIYTAAIQMPSESKTVPAIFTLETHLPDNGPLPVVRTIDDQQDMQFDLFTANKENDTNIYNAETQLFVDNKNEKSNQKIDNSIFDAETQLPTVDANKSEKTIFDAQTQLFTVEKEKVSNEPENKTEDGSKDKFNVSDEEILFDEVNSQSFEDDFFSQPLLPQDTSPEKDVEINLSQTATEEHEEKAVSPVKRVISMKSGSSTDCDDFDILPTQKIPEKRVNEDDLTDCEEDLLDDNVKKSKEAISKVSESSDVNFEDMATQIVELDVIASKSPLKLDTSVTNKDEIKTEIKTITTADTDVDFEDMATQIIEQKVPASKSSNKTVASTDKVDGEFEELPTQVLQEDIFDKVDFEDLPTQVIAEDIVIKPKHVKEELIRLSQEEISPFKIPYPTPIKVKRKDIPKLVDTKVKAPEIKPSSSDNDDDRYYAATQDIIDDLSSQQDFSPEVIYIYPDKTLNNNHETKSLNKKDAKSVEHNLAGKNQFANQSSSGSSDGDEKVNRFVASLSTSQIRDVIGVDAQVTKLKKVPSDPSDVEVTPKKLRPFRLMQTELPTSQEIKINVTQGSKSLVTESSSDSEKEDSQESQDVTPILFRRRAKAKNPVKCDLSKRLDVTALPTRVITRLRKPTSKIQDSDEETKKISKSILKPKFLTEQDIDVDKEIITENITRLKNDTEKKVSPKANKTEEKTNNRTNKAEETVVSDKKPVIKKESKSKQKAKVTENLEPDKPKQKSRRTRKTDSIKHTKTEADKTIEVNNSTVNDTISKTAKKSSLSNSSSNKSNSTLDSTVDTSKTSRSRRKTTSTDNTVTDIGIKSILSTSNKSNSTADTSSTRSSRHKRRVENKASISPEKEVVKRKRGRPKKEESSPEKGVEIRRSRRQRSIKEKDREETRVTKPFHEKSTVYSVSSESDVNSPKSLKRSADFDVEVPRPKRTRSVASSNSLTRPATPARKLQTQYVLFTAFPYEEVKGKLQKLGAVLVSDVSECSVVLTHQVKRTLKLLCAVGLGRPIVGPQWVQACVDHKALVDPWQYLLRDEATERRFGFRLSRALRGRRGFLRGYNVSATPSVMPNEAEMKMIVECSGGTWRAERPQWICLSCSADRALWPALRQQGAVLVSTEFILSGVLQQRMDIEGNRLDK